MKMECISCGRQMKKKSDTEWVCKHCGNRIDHYKESK